jgi:hypothetical protein
MTDILSEADAIREHGSLLMSKNPKRRAEGALLLGMCRTEACRKLLEEALAIETDETVKRSIRRSLRVDTYPLIRRRYNWP